MPVNQGKDDHSQRSRNSPFARVAALVAFSTAVSLSTAARAGFPDCNNNGVDDAIDIALCPPGDPACADCNANAIPDACDIADMTAEDCNANAVPDACELAASDCNANGLLDPCELATNDCNNNGIPDDCDVAPGGELLFDGVDDLIRVLNPVDLPLANAPRTIEAWVFPDLTSVNDGILVYGSSVNRQICGLIRSFNCTGKLYFYGFNTDACTLHNLPIAEWTHVAMTWDGLTLKLYMNAVLEYTGPLAPNTTLNTAMSATGLTVGRRPDSPGAFWRGRIDEVRIWNVVRTQMEIDQMRFRRLSGLEPGLVLYFNFDNIDGQFIPDVSGHGNNATIGALSTPGGDDPAVVPSSIPMLPGDCNLNDMLDECERGDMNGASGITLADLPLFIFKLTSPNPGCTSLADMNGDGVANGADIQSFTNALVNP